METNVVKVDKAQNYLWVEGDDDSNVCYHLLKHYQLEKSIVIVDKKGIGNILSTLKVGIKGSGPQRLGIVVDVDVNLESSWQGLSTRLIESGYDTVPISPNPGGTIIAQEGLPVVGIWLMPDNKIPGMLEDFVSFLLPPDDLLWPMAEDILQKVVEQDCRFRPTYRIKAKIHTWLAWQEEPGKPMGQAITKHYLDAEAPHAQEVISWIRKLFDLGSA